MNEKSLRFNKFIKKSNIVLSHSSIQVEACCHDDSSIGVVILPPDPNWGNHKTPLIESLFKACDQAGFSAIRFSFTKLAPSNQLSEQHIAQSAICIDELFRLSESVKDIYLVGHSYGALLALNLFLRRLETKAAIMIGAPLLYYDSYSWLTPCKGKIMYVYATNDETAPEVLHEAYIKLLKSKNLSVKTVSVLGKHDMTLQIPQVVSKTISYIKEVAASEEG